MSDGPKVDGHSGSVRVRSTVAFVATILIFGGMLLRGRLTAWSLLIGGPLYLVYLYLAHFTDLGASAAPVH